MLPILFILYAIYFIMVGINGNGSELINQLSNEKKFLYWILIIFILAMLWESPYLSKLAKMTVALVIIGFLLHNSNYKTIGSNAKQFLSGL